MVTIGRKAPHEESGDSEAATPVGESSELRAQERCKRGVSCAAGECRNQALTSKPMTTKTATPRLTKTQQILQMREETDQLLATLQARGKSLVVFPKRLLIAARRSL